MESTAPFFLALLWVFIGLLMLIGGGEAVIYGATRLARRLGITPFVIGLTVVAFGTSIPELFISLIASLQGHPDIMIGNIIGSNIANVGLILGCCAILAPLRLELKEVWTELLIVIAASIFVLLCSGYGRFPRIVGFAFVLSLISYTYLTYANRRNGDGDDQALSGSGNGRRQPFLITLAIVTGIALLGVGSTIFIDGAVSVARHFGISELIIGLTLTAVGTSLPELASSIAALRQRESGMLIGNVIGSNMFNLLMVFGLTGMIHPFSLDPELLRRDLPVMFAFTIVLIPMLRQDGTTRRWHGILLCSAYGLYCFSLL
ncbi:calcium/sodium antiporter [Desulfogranum mediterraneum]|uniref:calcium/sodium antiporter n=1 Tax=Desulfogranum mediterraneum TaxID=160661 RepID=UPI0004152F8D|nr:calcium/sodium antiporter [Desulfogranum mediterraneum]